MPTMNREWSLDKPTKQYINENDDGTFKIRVCQECFSTFEAAPVCPYCGAIYETTPIEIQNFKEIELKKVEEEKERKRQAFLNNIAEKVKNYKNAYDCKNWVELVKWCEYKKYKRGYAYVLAKQMGLKFRKGEIIMKEEIVKILEPKEAFKKLLKNNFNMSHSELIINERYASVFAFDMEVEFVRKIVGRYMSIKFGNLDKETIYIIREVRE